MTHRFAALVLVVAATATVGAADWPQWRGPNRDNQSTETGLFRTWPEGGPKVLWKTPVGDGYAGVAIKGGRLFINDYDVAKKEHVVRALVPSGASIDRIRFVSHRGEDPDYVEVMEQMGFDQGAVHARVSRGSMRETLRDPVFRLLAGNFLERAASGDEPPLPAIPGDLARLYPRPLGPVLPSDL